VVLIGIVSKDEHIKVHTKALREEGFEVLGLGSSPTDVPPNVDVLILRTQSCSHGGSDTAYHWNRTTKKPLIVENGLTGIRAKLQKLSPLLQRTPNSKEDSIMIPTSKYLPEKMDFNPKFPSLTGKNLPWSVASVPESRLRRFFAESLSYYKTISEDYEKYIADRFLRFQNEYTNSLFEAPEHPGHREFDRILSGRPIHFFMVMALILGRQGIHANKDYNRKVMQEAYATFCGSESSKGNIMASLWVIENLVLEVTPAEVTPAEVTPAEVTQDSITDAAEKSAGGAISAVGENHVITGAGLQGIRRDLEDFVLEVAGANQEILGLVKSLFVEVAKLREEVRTLRNLQPSQNSDAIQVLESLKERGFRVTLTTEK